MDGSKETFLDKKHVKRRDNNKVLNTNGVLGNVYIEATSVTRGQAGYVGVTAVAE